MRKNTRKDNEKKQRMKMNDANVCSRVHEHKSVTQIECSYKVYTIMN